jgi:hypothetical protein
MRKESLPQIMVVGNTSSGKTSVMVIIMEALRLHGFDVKICLAHESEYDDFITACTDLDLRKKSLKNRLGSQLGPISITEVHTRPKPSHIPAIQGLEPFKYFEHVFEGVKIPYTLDVTKVGKK